jgi:DNA helicase-2/ATP-dependent DNA helicase PcrA
MESNHAKLNSEQKKAVEHRAGPLLIVAGAGTGKTTVLIERLLFLIENKLAKPDEILITTFTEKAAGEMEDRADKLLPLGYFDIWISTFHGFCERILRENALDIGLPGDFKILTQTDQWILVRKNLEKFDLDYYRPLGNPTKFIHELLRHFSRLKDENISPNEYLRYAEELEQDNDGMLSGVKKNPKFESLNPKQIQNSKFKNQNDNSPYSGTRKLKIKKENIEIEIKGIEAGRIIELANAYHVYNQLLLDKGYFDFGDLISYTLKLFNERPNILKIYQEKFKYIMVDEFQDTNWAQYELIKMLARPKNNLTVVGDDDQSIYKFRGASLSNIMQFKDDYPEAEEIVLTKNYRSSQLILDKAYKFIKHNNPNRLEIRLGIKKELISEAKIQADVKHLDFTTGDDEARGVAQEILNIKNKDPETRWSDFAILVRANDTAEKFINELTILEIPNQFVSHKGLYLKPLVMDLVAYLKLLDNYHESSALYRVLSMEQFKVGHEDVININKFARHKVWSMYEALKNIEAIPNVSAESIAHIKKLMLLVSKHSVLAKSEKTSKILISFIYDSGLLDNLDYDRDVELFAYLNQFYKKIKNMEEDLSNAQLKEIVMALDMEIEAGETGSIRFDYDDEEAVKIMTVHAAKGLEFKNVFIVNMVDKKFPTIARGEKISIPDALVRERLPEGDIHTEEERRLFYVALTRAKERLYLTSAKDYGGARDKKPSRFLVEAEVLAEVKDVKSIRKVKKENDLTRDIEMMGKERKVSIKLDYFPDKFSFSKIEAFNNCPFQYKLNFILGIPVLEKISFIFGKVMHNTLYDFFASLFIEKKQQDLFSSSAKKKLPSQEELLKIYERHWKEDGYASKEQREEYKKKGRAMLIKLFEKYETEGWPKVLYMEKKFSLKIGDYIFIGTVDRIDELADGSLEIVDYKTGAPKTKLDFDGKKQLILYKMAVEELLQKKVNNLSYFYLETGEKMTFSASDKDMEKLKIEIFQTAEEMKKGEFPPKAGFLCAYCDFKTICEFRSNGK